jgi:hypothetical protein
MTAIKGSDLSGVNIPWYWSPSRNKFIKGKSASPFRFYLNKFRELGNNCPLKLQENYKYIEKLIGDLLRTRGND